MTILSLYQIGATPSSSRTFTATNRELKSLANGMPGRTWAPATARQTSSTSARVYRGACDSGTSRPRSSKTNQKIVASFPVKPRIVACSRYTEKQSPSAIPATGVETP